MKKIATLILIIMMASLAGGLYGIVHDQLTYTISQEYYTKFKFHQFELVPSGFEGVPSNPRVLVSIVGFLATWWVGTFIGIILGAVSLILPTWKIMLSTSIKAFIITMAVAFLTGVVGLSYGYFVLAHQPASAFKHWFIPSNLVDFKSFIIVGSMHNFSYLGGVIGLVVGKVYIVYVRFTRYKTSV